MPAPTARAGAERKVKVVPAAPYHVEHASFDLADAEKQYGPATCPAEPTGLGHLPDETTRDYAMRMHYAAHRLAKATDTRSRNRWERIYLQFRDRIVLGNRKLVYRAVRRWQPTPNLAEDLTSDCQVVLIQAVAAYNPWMGIRFSTYAFTCLMRALSRLSQKHANDRLSRSMPLESLPDGEPRDSATEEVPSNGMAILDEYLGEHHELLSSREKRVIARRFCLDEQNKAGTLEQVGRELGLSKERVRQVQASALDKLRKAILEEGGGLEEGMRDVG